MSTLFSKLFIESFESLKASDNLGGIISPYSVPAKDSLAISVDTIESFDNSTQIVGLHRRIEDNINQSKRNNMDGFKTLCFRIEQALELNKLFKNDSTVREKLAEILAYSYVSHNREYLIYPDFNTAKNKALAVFKVAYKLGLNFFDSQNEDAIKLILLSVLFKKKPEDKKDAKSSQSLQPGPQSTAQPPQSSPAQPQ